MEPDRYAPPSTPPHGPAGGDGMASGQRLPNERNDPPAPRRTSAWKRALRAVGVLLLTVVVLVGGLLLWLQTETGATTTLGWLVDRFNPYEDAAIEVERVSGNWLSNLDLYGLELRRADGSPMARIDSLELSYNLLAIPNGRLHLRDVLLAGARLDVREGADGAFDIALPFLPDTLAAQDTTRGRGLVVQVDRADVRRTRAAVTFYTPPPAPDSTLVLSGVTLAARDFLLGEELTFQADTLALAYALPRDQGRGTLRAGASLDDNLLAVRALRLESTASDLFARGTVRLPDVGGADAADGDRDSDILRDLDLTVRAEPLAFQDLTLLLPDLDPSRSVTLRADVRGDLDELIVDVAGETSDGATFGLEGSVAPPGQGEQVAFVLGGRVRDLDLGFFGPADAQSPGLLSATFETDLEGGSLETISGTAQALVVDTRVAGFALDRTRLDVRADDGTFRVDVETGTRGARVAARGTVRPFADVPAYDLRGRFSDLDLAAFTDGQQSSDLNGTFRVEGAGVDPETIRADLGLSLTGARVNAYTIDAADLDLDVRGRRVSGLVAASLPQGGLRADLSADLSGEVPTYRVRDGVLTGLDVAALIGDTTQSRVNARFSLTGRGFAPRTLALDADVRLDDTVWGTYVVETADADVALRRGALDLALEADLEGGAFDLDLAAQPFADPIRYTIRQGRFTNVDIGRLTNNPGQTSDLTGTIVGSGTGLDPQTLVLDARVTLADSRLNAQPITSADGSVSARSGRFDFDLALQTPQGRTQLAGDVSLQGGELAASLRNSSFAGLDVGALLGLDFSTNLNGRGTLVVRGTDPQTMTLAADLQLDRSLVNGALVPVGSLEATLADGRADVSARLGLVEGVVAVDAEGRFFDERPTYRAEGVVSNVNVTRLFGLDSTDAALDLRFDVAGEGIDPQTMEARLAVVGDTSRFQSVEIYDITARAAISEGVVDVETLVFESNVADAAGSGRVALFDTLGATSDFEVAAQLRSLDPVRPFLPPDTPLSAESGRIVASVSGPRGALRVEGSAALESFVYNSVRAGGLEAEVAGVIGEDFAVQSGRADATIGFLSLPVVDNLRRTDLEVAYDGSEIAFLAEVDRDDRRDARLKGRVDLRPEAQRVALDTLNLRFDEERFRLLLPATIAYGDGYRVSNFLLASDDQQVAIDGVVDPRGEQNLIATFDNLRLDGFTDLIGYGQVGGTLDGQVDLTGPAFAPNLTGALDLELTSRGDSVGTLDLDVVYDALRLQTDATFTHDDGSVLVATGYIPIDLRLSAPTGGAEAGAGRPEGVRVQAAAGPDEANVDLEVVADDFSVDWILPFLPRRTVTDFAGALDAEITIGGTLDDPALGGFARLQDGKLGLEATSLTYDDIDAYLTLSGSTVTVDSLTLRSGGGRAEATGTLAFEQLTVGALELTAYANDLLAIDNEQYRFVADAALEIGGTTRAPVITGDATVISGDIFLGEGEQFEQVPLTDEDILTVESTFGIRVETADTTTANIVDAMTLDMDIELERDTWIRSTGTPAIDIQFFGEIDAEKQPGGDIQLFGAIDVVPDRSKIVFLGRRFEIRQGELFFNGSILETLLNLNAELVVYRPGTRERVASVTLAVDGRLNALDREDAITLGGDPYSETADIVSLIATGRPAGQGFGADDAGNLGASALAGLVQGAASRGVGLDVIEIEQDGTRGTRLTAGKYLNRRFYASYSQPITYGSDGEEANAGAAGQPTITIEYELTDWLLGRLLYDRALFRLNLQTETSF